MKAITWNEQGHDYIAHAHRVAVEKGETPDLPHHGRITADEDGHVRLHHGPDTHKIVGTWRPHDELDSPSDDAPPPTSKKTTRKAKSKK